MAVVTCTFQVDNAMGGDLSGPWFDNGSAGTSNTTGHMHKGNHDELFVVLQWNAGSAPDFLTGHIVFSKAETASASQTAASPFKNRGDKQLCHKAEKVHVAGGGAFLPSYKWGPFPLHDGSQLGKYELTFVAEDTTPGEDKEIQWSEDPEFDVES